jgi:hypothetical protein
MDTTNFDKVSGAFVFVAKADLSQELRPKGTVQGVVRFMVNNAVEPPDVHPVLTTPNTIRSLVTANPSLDPTVYGFRAEHKVIF